MSFRSLVIAITFLAIFAMATRFAVDTDTWWHLRTGEQIAQQGSIPTVDQWSYTRQGQPWSYPSSAWLSELQLYFIYSAAGASGLGLWTAAMVTLAFAFVYLAMSGPPLLRSFILVLAVAVSGIYWAARPYMLSFVLAAAFLWVLEDNRWGRRDRLVWLLPLMVLWVNSHPGFGIGMLLLAVYVGEKAVLWLTNLIRRERKAGKANWNALRHLLLIGLGLLVAASLNPAGPAVLAYPFETVSIGELRDYIQEWQSPNFHILQAQPFAWMMLLALAILGASVRRVVLSDVFLIAGLGYMSMLAVRNVPLFALAGAIVISRYAAPLLEDATVYFRIKGSMPATAPWQAWFNAGIVAFLALAVFARLASIWPADNDLASFTKLPSGAVAYLRENQPEGRLFNSYNWGGYLTWALREYPVYIDGRTDLYAGGLLAEWIATVSAEDGWQATLDNWDVRLVLLEPSWALAKLLPYEGWQLLYEDDHSVLYGR
jgi:hypothetical protein